MINTLAQKFGSCYQFQSVCYDGSWGTSINVLPCGHASSTLVTDLFITKILLLLFYYFSFKFLVRNNWRIWKCNQFNILRE